MKKATLFVGLALLMAACSPPKGTGFDHYDTYSQSNPRPQSQNAQGNVATEVYLGDEDQVL